MRSIFDSKHIPPSQILSPGEQDDSGVAPEVHGIGLLMQVLGRLRAALAIHDFEGTLSDQGIEEPSDDPNEDTQ